MECMEKAGSRQPGSKDRAVSGLCAVGGTR